jgi:hypothetical protein
VLTVARCVLVAAVSAFAASSALAGALVQWRTPDGRTGFSDRDRVPPDAVIVAESARSRPELCELLELEPDVARMRLRGGAVIAADHRRHPTIAVCARDSIRVAEEFGRKACDSADYERLEERAVEAAVRYCRDRHKD